MRNFLVFALVAGLVVTGPAIQARRADMSADGAVTGHHPSPAETPEQRALLERCRAQAQAGPSKAVLFSDNFEDGDLMGWTNEGSCSMSATNAMAAHGTVYSLTHTGNCGHLLGARRALPSIAPNYICLYLRSSATNLSSYFVAGDANLGIGSNWGAIFLFAGSGSWRLTYWENIIAPMSPNQWYQFEFLVNWVTKTMTVYIDGALRISNTPFRDSSVNALTQMHLYNVDNATMWADEITMMDAAGPTPTTGPSATPTPAATNTPTASPTPTVPLPLPATGPIGGMVLLAAMALALTRANRRRSSK